MAVFGNPWLAKEKRRVDRGLVLLQVVAGLALLIGPAYALTFSITHPRQPRPMPVSNCKNIATALELYSCDNGGRYPLSAGNYLKLIPTCPAAGFPQYVSETGLEEQP